MRIRILKTCICYHEVASFQHGKGISDEICGSVNKLGFSDIIKWIGSVFGRSAEPIEPIVSRLPMQDAVHGKKSHWEWKANRFYDHKVQKNKNQSAHTQIDIISKSTLQLTLRNHLSSSFGVV